MTLDIWSCDPADIPVWTEFEKARLCVALSQIFDWKTIKMTTDPERKAYEHSYTGKYFQHTDGGLYQFQQFAQYTDRPGEFAAVYLHIWPFEQALWIRPIAEWQPTRFKQIDTEVVNALRLQNPEPAKQAITAKRAARKAAATAAVPPVSAEVVNGAAGL